MLHRLLAVALLGLLAGCSRPGLEDDGVRVEMSVTPRPPAAGSVHLEIRLRDAAGRPLPATAVELEANMAHPGMKPSFATARREAPDRWQADVELPMGGDWVVRVDALLADGRRVRHEVPLPGVESR